MSTSPSFLGPLPGSVPLTGSFPSTAASPALWRRISSSPPQAASSEEKHGASKEIADPQGAQRSSKNDLSQTASDAYDRTKRRSRSCFGALLGPSLHDAAQAPRVDATKKPFGATRDFTLFPAVYAIERPIKNLWLKGDSHGDLERDLDLWRSNNLAQGDARDIQHWGMAKSAAEAHRQSCDGCVRCDKPWNEPAPIFWTGDDAVLCITGDLINKGFFNLATLDFYIELQAQARAVGGDVVITMGNHELSALRNIKDAKSAGPGGLLWELPAYSIDPSNAGFRSSRFGQFLFNLPIVADVGHVVCAHGGQPSSRTLDGLLHFITAGMKTDGFDSPALTGTNSILQRRNWYGKDGWQGPSLVKILKRSLLAFGHDPDSIEPTGQPVFFGLDAHKHPSLLRMDCGESRGIGNGGYSPGYVICIKHRDHKRTAEVFNHLGKRTQQVELAFKQVIPPDPQFSSFLPAHALEAGVAASFFPF